jgi:hypothetical protein
VLKHCAFLLLLAACVPNLKTDADLLISCSNQDECPTGFECAAGLCAPLNGNAGPTITIGAVTQSATDVAIPITAYDAESDDVSVTFELGRNGALTALPLSAVVSASPDGTTTQVRWDAASYFASNARLANLTVRVTPRDRFRTGQSVLSPPFAFGNSPPFITALQVGGGGSVRGTVPIAFLVIDDDDVISVSRAALRQGDRTIVIDVQNAANFPGTNLSGLASSALGSQATLAWDSSLTLAEPGVDTTLELVVMDSLGAESVLAVSPPFVLANAPSVALSLASSRGLDSASVRFDAAAATGRSVVVAFSYRVDGGAWTAIGSAPGPSGTFVWDARSATALTLTARDRDGDGSSNDDLSVLDYRATLELQAVATDDTLLSGVPAVSPVFALGDAPPTITLNAISGTQRNEVPIAFALSDAQADLANVELEFCLATDVCTADAPPASAGWRRMQIGFGSVASLAAESATPHVVTWRSTAPALDTMPTQEQGIGARLLQAVSVRGRASNRVEGSTVFGAWSAPIVIDEVRNQSPPRIADLSVRRLGVMGGASPVTIQYTLFDEESDLVDIECLFSQNGGSFQRCAEYADPRSEGRYDLLSSPPTLSGGGGVAHTFMWDPSGQLAPAASTQIKLVAYDGNGQAFAQVFTDQPAAIRNDKDRLFSTFQDAFTVTGGYGPNQTEDVLSGMVPADVNLDGLPDVVAAFAGLNASSPSLRVFFGQGSDGIVTGNRELGSAQQTTLTHKPLAISLGDVDGDAASDVVLVSAAALTVMPNDGAGVFVTEQHEVLSGQGAALAVADFDQDGHSDAAVATASPSSVSIYYGGPSGFTGAQSYALPFAPRKIVSGDFDRDATLDVAVLGVSGNVFVLPGFGTRAFDLLRASTVTVSGVTLDAADVDADGSADLAIGGPSGASLLLNGGDGTFSRVTVTTEQTGLTRFTDLTGDGAPDLFVARPADAILTPVSVLYVNDGAGGFTQQVLISDYSGNTATHITDLFAVDFGGDHGPDVFHSVLRLNLDGYQLVRRLVGGFIADYANSAAPSFTGSGFGPLRFAKGKDFGAGGAYASISLPIDLDRDGRLDLATVRGDSTFGPGLAVPSTLGLWRSLGTSGTGGEPSLNLLGSHTLPGYMKAIARGEFNGDGVDDVVVVGAGVRVLFGTGNRSFTNGPSLTSLSSGTPTAVTVADFNADGFDDIAVGRLFSRLSIWLGSGAGTFVNVPDIETGLHSTSYPGQNFFNYEARGLAACDVNADGKLDLVVSNHFGDFGIPKNGSISIRLGDGAGSFAPTGGTGPNSEIVVTPEIAEFFHPYDLVCADFDRDGIADIATIGTCDNSSQLYPWPKYGVILFGNGADGVGDGTFQAPVSIPNLPTQPLVTDQLLHRMLVGDLDNDGVLDFGFANSAGGIVLLRGTGDRAAPFADARDLTGPAVRPSLAFSDLDDDQMLDVVVTSSDRYFNGSAENVSFYATRFDSREPWRRVVRDPPLALRPTGVDRAGKPKQGPVLSLNRAAKGPRGEADPTSALRRTLPAQTASLVPITDMWRATGDVVFKRQANDRLRVMQRWTGVAELPVELPLYSSIGNARLASGSVKVFQAKTSWRRANEQVGDTLFNLASGADFLPRLSGQDLIMERVTWSQVPTDKVALQTSVEGGRRVRVLVEQLGYFQAFLDLP